jgi:hypothetical protein
VTLTASVACSLQLLTWFLVSDLGEFYGVTSSVYVQTRRNSPQGVLLSAF